MYSCVFFGHRDSPESLGPRLYEAIENLILHHQVNRFFVGYQGAFDRMAADILSQISAKYPAVDYAVVLAYLPSSGNPPRFAHPACCPTALNPSPAVLPFLIGMNGC